MDVCSCSWWTLRLPEEKNPLSWVMSPFRGNITMDLMEMLIEHCLFYLKCTFLFLWRFSIHKLLLRTRAHPNFSFSFVLCRLCPPPHHHHISYFQHSSPPSIPGLHCVAFSFSSSSSSTAAVLEVAPTRLNFGGLDPAAGKKAF